MPNVMMNMEEIEHRNGARALRWLTLALAWGLVFTGYGLILAACWPLEVHLRLTGFALASLIALLWLGSYPLRQERLPSVGLVGMTVLIAAGFYLGLRRELLAPALVAALAGWDLDLFARRLRSVRAIECKVIIRHLLTSFAVAGLALGLLLAGLFVRLQLSFGLALLLAAVSFVSLVLILRLGQA